MFCQNRSNYFLNVFSQKIKPVARANTEIRGRLNQGGGGVRRL